MRRILVLASFLSLIFIVNGCTVQKKKGEASTLGKIYHNTTAKYNGYFNADLIMQESLISLESQYQDNYNQILPIYPYAEAPNPKSVAENLDKAIEKVSIIATIHEPSHWVDDCYVLLGKAQFLKQDYETAEKTFEFFADEFDPLNKRTSRLKKTDNRKRTSAKKSAPKRPTKKVSPTKTKSRKTTTKKSKTRSTASSKPGSKKRPATPGTKKRPEKTEEQKAPQASDNSNIASETITSGISAEPVTNLPNSSPSSTVSTAEKNDMFGHEPVYQEGLLWLARTYIHRERFSLAAYYLDKVEGDIATPKKIRNEIPIVRAFYHLKKKDYDFAIPYLEQAVKLSSDRNEKARLTFIVAQLHQLSGRQDMAFSAYDAVIKLHPDYEMEFNAELNLAKAAWASGRESSESAVNRLEKMAKEDKNFDYRDQIYFTIGTIYLKLKNRNLAIENFRESIRYNTSNAVQGAETYYALATYFYEEEEYDGAKYHYDSTLISLPKSDERYAEVKKRSENLKDIATFLGIIKLQDSLLRVSDMSPEKQREIAASIKKKQELAANPKSANQNLSPNLTNSVPVSATASIASAGGKNSNFFAYDMNKVRRGQNEFRKYWGPRTLEDDWRRSNKASGSISSSTSEEKIARSMTDEEVREILKDVPFSAKQKATALSKMEDAYFNLGKLYRSKLEQYEKSTAALEKLILRNPNTTYKEEAYYYLYLSFNDISNYEKSEYYKQLLIQNFPDSKYTLSITDPNYARNILNEAKKTERMYGLAYELFSDGLYADSKNILEELSTKSKEDLKGLEAKIDLLKAMCDGNIEGEDAYITSLNFVVNKHPKTPEETRAKEILRFIKGDKQAFDPILYNESGEDFKEDADKLHYVLVVIYSESGKDMTDAKIKVSTFNQKYHDDEKLRISSIFLNKEDGAQLILVRKFRDKAKAMEYYNNVQKNKEEYVSQEVEYDIFAVTQQSYREIIKQRSVKGYRGFFEASYLANSSN